MSILLSIDSTHYMGAAILALSLLCYLAFVLLKPEKF